MRRVAVIGGGAAGMLAAYAAAAQGASVTVLEKNEKLGKKLFITGKGRCNITNTAPQQAFFEKIKHNPKFLYKAFHTFDNFNCIDLLNKNGLPTKEERGGRVFPASDKSSDVIKTLSNLLKKEHVSVKLNTKVTGIEFEPGFIRCLHTNQGDVMADAYILATGGMSYPLTGSTGDGYRFAQTLGHTVTELHGSLVPVETYGEEAKALQGLSLRNVSLTLFQNGKKLYTETGEMLFTHFGVSGPLVLSASAHLKTYDFQNTILEIDLKPGLSEEVLERRILRDFETQKNKQFKNALDGLLPQKLIPVFIARTGISPEKQVNSVTKEERKKIVACFKRFTFRVKGLRPIEEAIVTRGGILIKEIDPATMRSKRYENLYFSGEIIDLDGCTGGYNLQIAFSTGYLAGLHAAL